MNHLTVKRFSAGSAPRPEHGSAQPTAKEVPPGAQPEKCRPTLAKHRRGQLVSWPRWLKPAQDSPKQLAKQRTGNKIGKRTGKGAGKPRDLQV